MDCLLERNDREGNFMKFQKNITIITIITLIITLCGCTRISTSTISDTEITKLKSSELKKVTLSSKALKQEMKLNIYLPKGYSNMDKYPVLYIIHGYSGNEDSWMPGLKLDKKADELIDSNKIKPMIIVAPQIDNSYGINSSKNTRKLGDAPETSLNEGLYEDYLYKEVVPFIDSNYSTVSSKEGRYVGGLSMGGCVALHLAFSHSDMFSKVGGNSPALFVNEFPNGLDRWLYPNESLRNERDPIYIAQNKDLKSLQVYLDCGDNDSYKFYKGCDKLYKILHAKGIESQYHLNAGAHDGAYWEANMENYLLFYAGI
jgi:enterochelin esterase-like enzyme